jgi:glycerol-3-phosphate acyltransferase PlsY
LAYFLGSFPAGYLIGKLWHVNVLDRGSGRTGGTNVFRSAGLAAGLFTGAVDIGKGFLAVWLAGQISSNALVQVLAGAAVILGHIHSIFLGFRGGAGVATSLGALAAIYLPAAIGLLIVLVLVMVLTRYASLGSLTVSVLMPIVLLILGLTNIVSLVYVMYGLLAFVIIVYAHQGNIRRLLQGTERRLGPPRH